MEQLNAGNQEVPNPIGQGHFSTGGVDPDNGTMVLAEYQDPTRFIVFTAPPWIPAFGVHEGAAPSYFYSDDEKVEEEVVTEEVKLTMHAVRNPWGEQVGEMFRSRDAPRMEVRGNLCVFASNGGVMAFRLDGDKERDFQRKSCKATAVCMDISSQRRKNRILYCTENGDVMACSFNTSTSKTLFGKPSLLVSLSICQDGVTSMACDPLTGTIFLASSKAQHTVWVVHDTRGNTASAGERNKNTASSDDSKNPNYFLRCTLGSQGRGTIDDDRLSHPSVFQASDCVYLVSDGIVYEIVPSSLQVTATPSCTQQQKNWKPQLTQKATVRENEFLLNSDAGSPDPLEGTLLAVNKFGAYRIVAQSYNDSWLVRRRPFP